MTTSAVKKIVLTELEPKTTNNNNILSNPLKLLSSLEIPCYIRLGTLTITIEDLQNLKEDQILPLVQKTDEPVDIVVNEKVIARGKIMSSDDYFAIQVTEIA